MEKATANFIHKQTSTIQRIRNLIAWLRVYKKDYIQALLGVAGFSSLLFLSRLVLPFYPKQYGFSYYLMTFSAIFLLSVLLVPSLSLTAQLSLLEYDPLLFELNFSSAISQPAFQLLYNNIHDIPYSVLTTANSSKTFQIRAAIEDLKSSSKLQSYSLLFNSPLTVGDGQLEISSYTLKASKPRMEVDFPAAIGVLLIICAYFFNMFTEIGKLSIEFIQIYVLFMFQNDMATTLYKVLYHGMVLIPPRHILLAEPYESQSYVLICLALPLSILYFFAFVGYLCKKVAPSDRAILGTIVYELLTFDAFLQCIRIFYFNLLFNSIQFLILLGEGLPEMEKIREVGIVLVYFNIITLLGILYIKLYILNPRLGMNEESWQLYLQSQTFKEFRVLHHKSHLQPWYKRNYSLFNTLRMIFIIASFFWSALFQYCVLLLEFLHIFYTFTVRPFQEEYYINIVVICRLCFLSEYLFIVLANLYYSTGHLVFNYYTAYDLVVARDSMFLVIMFSFLIAIFFEIYFMCSNLNYQIKLVREADQLKIEITQKHRTDTEVKDSKDNKFGTMVMSDRRSKSSSRRFDSVSGISMSPRKKHRKDKNIVRNEDIEEKEKKEKPRGSHLAEEEEDKEQTSRGSQRNEETEEKKSKRRRREPQVQIQMANIKELKLSKVESSATEDRERLRSSRHKGRWKKQSLLEEMIQHPQ